MGVAVAAFAVIAGQAVMVLSHAPDHLAWLNLAAIGAAAALFPAMSWSVGQAMRHADWTAGFAAAAVLASLVLGPEIDGVRRWLGAPGLAIHVGHLVIPLALGAAARRASAWTGGGLAVLSLGLAAQPDAAAAFALASALGVLLALQRSLWIALGFAAAVAAAVWTILNPDALAPVPWVEGVAQTALQMELWLGFLVMLGLSLLPMPFLFVAVQGRRRRPLAGALAVYWSGLIAASFLGAFPTPLVGYGVGPILGYVLSWALLRSPIQRRPEARQR